VTPVLDSDLKEEILDMLYIQLADNRKAVWVDAELRNVSKRDNEAKPVQAQREFYNYLKRKNISNNVSS